MTRRRDLLLAGAAAGFASLGDGVRAAGLPPIAVPGVVARDWPTASPQSQGIDAAGLAAVFEDGAGLPPLRSLVVVRNGLLVAERYYGGASADDLLPVNSVTKSVTSMLVGQAIDRGALPGLAATVGALLPEATARLPDSAAARVTLRDILAGHAGLAYDFQKQYMALSRARDPLGFALALPADPAGRERWTYNDAAVGLLSPILTRAHGLDLATVAARDLFAPLGIDRFAWSRNGNGDITTYGGLMLRTRDLARLCWTMADAGRWGGAQVVPAAWVAESTRPHGAADWRVRPVGDVGYGFLWFTGTLQGRPVFWGWGYGAQYAFVVPSLRLVVATAAEPPRPEALLAQNDTVMALVARVAQAAA